MQLESDTYHILILTFNLKGSTVETQLEKYSILKGSMVDFYER